MIHPEKFRYRRFRLNNKSFERKIVNISYPSVSAFVLGAQKNSLMETVLLSTPNICFGGDIRKLQCYQRAI